MSRRERATFRGSVAVRPLVGTWLTFGDPVVAEIAGGSGLDFVIIDGEHAPLGPESIHRLVGAAGGIDQSVLVRVATNAPTHISVALDAGADGVVIPQVRSAEDAARAVEASHYPPHGTRGWGPRRPSAFGRESSEYRADTRERTTVIVQVELREAVDDLERILAVPGLDGILVGPNDLAGSLGHPGQPTDPAVTAVIESVVASAVAAQVPIGIACADDPDVIGHWLRRGCRFVALSADYLLLAQGFDRLAARRELV